jgi:polysaccharide pyruvyl transferase WcaK-like protein
MHRRLHIHIGHDFFGAGNIGDDWMLAGFLGELRHAKTNVRLTCCSPHNTEAMRHRFPQVEWHAADLATRQSLITAADAWLGLGGTPFQTDSTTYFLDYIAKDLTWAEQASVPAYFLGVGVESSAAAAMPQTRFILERTHRVWTRDKLSAQLLQDVNAESKIEASADLAHLFFSSLNRPALSDRLDGLVINVENPNQVSRSALSQFLVSRVSKRLLWLAQEVRSLAVSEMTLWTDFTFEEKAALELCVPDYSRGLSNTFVQPYDRLKACLTTRYHSALAAAWRGASVSIFARSQKLEGLLQQLPLGRCSALNTADNFETGLRVAQPASEAILQHLTSQIRNACGALFQEFGLLSHPEKKLGPRVTWEFQEGWYSEEQANGSVWRWASDQSDLAIHVSTACMLCLRGNWATLAAPNSVMFSLPDGTTRIAEITTLGFSPLASIEFRAPAGLSILRLRVSQPSVQPPGDSRFLALAWQNPSITRVEHDTLP